MKKPVEPHQAYRLLAHGPVLLLTTQFHGQPNVMTAGWSTPLSGSEALIGVAVAPTRLSHEFIVKTDQFALNVPHLDLLGRVWHCGTVSGRDADKWMTAPLTPAEATEIDCPLSTSAWPGWSAPSSTASPSAITRSSSPRCWWRRPRRRRSRRPGGRATRPAARSTTSGANLFTAPGQALPRLTPGHDGTEYREQSTRMNANMFDVRDYRLIWSALRPSPLSHRV